jgi:hypothetical protein
MTSLSLSLSLPPLLLLSLSISCRPNPPSDPLPSTYPYLPLGSLGYGVNIVTLSPFVQQVINFTYDDVSLYYDPNATFTSMLVPDQIAVLPNPTSDITANVYASQQEYYDSKTFGIGLGDVWGIGGAAFSLSGSVQKTMTTIGDGAWVYAEASQNIVLFTAQVDTWEPAVTPEFYAAVTALSSPADYDSFISTWGTHVAVSASLGGRWYASAYFPQSYVEQVSSLSIGLSMKLQLNQQRSGSVSFGAQYNHVLSTSSVGHVISSFPPGSFPFFVDLSEYSLFTSLSLSVCVCLSLSFSFPFFLSLSLCRASSQRRISWSTV